VVWSETRVEADGVTGVLLAPTTTGPFQNAPLMSLLALMAGQAPKAVPELYNDSAVIAYRVPAGDLPMTDLHPDVTSSSGSLDPSLLADGDFARFAALPMAPVGQKAWIQFAFSKPVAIRGVSLAIAGFKWPFGPPPAGPDLEASDDGRSFRKVVNVPRSTAVQNTVSFAPISARFFRVAFVTPPPAPPMEIDLPLPPPPAEHQVAELVLHTGARVTRFEEKAAFVPLAGLSDLGTPATAPADAVRKSEVLTSRRRWNDVARLTRRRASGSCSAWATRSWASPTTRRLPRARASRWTS
jgi:hypothetical protein